MTLSIRCILQVGKSRYGTPPDVQLRDDAGTGSSQVERVCTVPYCKNFFQGCGSAHLMRIRVQRFSLMQPRIRILFLKCDANPRPLVHRPSAAPFMSIHSSPRLHFEPVKLQNFDLNADPDSPFRSSADQDSDKISNYSADQSGSATRTFYLFTKTHVL